MKSPSSLISTKQCRSRESELLVDSFFILSAVFTTVYQIMCLESCNTSFLRSIACLFFFWRLPRDHEPSFELPVVSGASIIIEIRVHVSGGYPPFIASEQPVAGRLADKYGRFEMPKR